MKQSTKINSYSETQLYNFVKAFLLSRYDKPVEIPKFHREMWRIVSEGHKRIAFAAPRGHAKSTSITHALTLFLFLFRHKRYGIIVSDTQDQAIQFLGDIKNELVENLQIREFFGVKQILKDAVTDIIVEMDDGYKFRLQALGSEQKVRGRKWGNSRPDYIVCDDLENDEMVENDDRREKFRGWFLKALVPSLAKGGSIIVIGTILHMDSLLMRLMSNKSWTTKLYKAHDSFDDFTNILWPQQWPEVELRLKRQEYIDDGFAEGYAQEYLNDPTAHSEVFFDKADFLPMEEGHRHGRKLYYAGVDLAISDADKAAYTAIVIGGMDEQGILHIERVVRFRGDAYDIISVMLDLQKLYQIEMWKVEEGMIKRTLMGEMYRRMQDANIYMNIVPGIPTKDKRSRARPAQSRIRAGGVRFDKESEWYPAFELEMIQFPKSRFKDQVDAFAWLCIAINELSTGPTQKELDDEEYKKEMEPFERAYDGRSEVTGY